MPTLVTECYYMGGDGHGRGLRVKQILPGIRGILGICGISGIF